MADITSSAADPVSKSEFSRILGLDRSRVSQFIAQGLEVGPDGRLDRIPALRWVAENTKPMKNGTPSAGDRARDLLAAEGIEVGPAATYATGGGAFTEARIALTWEQVEWQRTRNEAALAAEPSLAKLARTRL